MEKSNLDVAYEIMLKTGEPMTFANLWNAICDVQNYSEEEAKKRMSKFYTNLFMDGRFITLGDNTWDLRDSYTFDRVHIDMNDVYHDEYELFENEELDFDSDEDEELEEEDEETEEEDDYEDEE